MPPETSHSQAAPEANAIDRRHPIQLRRWFFAALVTLTVLGFAALMVWTLSSGGIDAIDLTMITLFSITLPWTAVGFWNAVIGLIIMRSSTDPAATVCPPLADATDGSLICTRTALLSCIRNEDAEVVGRNLNLMIEGLVEAGEG